MKRREWTGGLLLLLLLACGDDPTPPSLARFERPNRVDFVCVLAGEPVQLEHCKNDIGGNQLALHALVTQSARGEIAALDLDAARVLDSRRDIPGFTFLPVGEMPVAVVVPPRHPEVTYVASYGSSDIRALTTAALVAPQSGDATLRILRLALDASDQLVVLQPGQAAAEAGLRVIAPTDMVLSPDEAALIVAARDVGHVVWIPIDRCQDGAQDCTPGLFDEEGIVAVPLEASIALALSSAPEPAAPEAYEQVCEYRGGGPPELATPPPVPPADEMTAPKPRALAVDADCPEDGACTPRVLVADESLPLIHVLDLDALAAGGDPTAAVLAPLLTGAPTIAVAVSPWVPATVTGSGETQYVYAIDADDRSVMVLERGQLLAVNSGASGRLDRIAYQTDAGATALAIATPGFDVDEGAAQWVDANACTDDAHPTKGDPSRLRGVFLATAHTDGIVRFVDIHDMELREPTPCRECPDTDPPMPVLVRHRQRLATSFLPGEDGDAVPASTPISEPRFVADNLPFSVRADGTTGNPEVPGLDCIACDAPFLTAFPPAGGDGESGADGDADGGVDNEGFAGCAGATPALVCGQADPWSGAGEQWIATYEGLIPGTVGGQGRLIPEGDEASVTGAFELAAEVDFCRAGVLGEEDIAPSYEGQICEAAGAKEHGDQLVLRPILPSHELLHEEDSVVERCKTLREALEQDDAEPLGFEIRRAYRDRLVLRKSLTHEIESAGVVTFADLAPCLASGLIAFDVRTTDQFTVQGSLSGFQHAVRANAAGRCVVSDDADPLRQGRARPGCTFRNRALEFRLHPPDTDEDELPPRPGTALAVSISTRAPKLVVNVGISGFGSVNVVADQMRYDPISRRLYVVDVHGRGLIPIPLDGVPDFITGTFN